ncbi:hypothetical protein R3W88_025530 [Solanum pinnatisectum]|uniref:Non-haem dioxygenase N-terminal domain-containing protein n=1 Tax=Solanum pinnatisectum TaxID=50273 RepID=A0AAV9M539_9SOLN|nr:hypothetical protein R3W88_025530 [Solanum pinnatisectum]
MDYDPSDEVKAIDDTKAGVKGLVDSGIVEIPRIFIRPPHELAEELNMCKATIQVPVVDLSGIQVEDGCKKIVIEIRAASEKWGFFQLINHGVPSRTYSLMYLSICSSNNVVHYHPLLANQISSVWIHCIFQVITIHCCFNIFSGYNLKYSRTCSLFFRVTYHGLQSASIDL